MLLGSSKKRRTSKSVFHLRHFTQISFLRSNLFRQRRHYKRKFFPSTCKATDDENIARQIAEYLLHARFYFFPNVAKEERTSLLFLQLATQFFSARQVAKRGCYARNFVRSLCPETALRCRKELPRVTAPSKPGKQKFRR